MRKFPAVAAAVALTLLAGCTSSGHPAASASQSPSAPGSSAEPTPSATFTPSETQAYYHQQLAWTSCGGKFQCATMRVPLNYDDPASRLIDIAVVKLPASDPGKRIGSLVVNPGGPGGSGVEYARAATQIVTKQILQKFDIVGFDPRGVAASTPVRCVGAKEMDAYLSIDAVPESGTAVTAIEQASKAFAAGCQAMSGNLLPYVGTRDAARDMDVLRAALGDEKITYLGKSYGTYLGGIYAEMFPTKIRALVLDGALDPSLSGEATDRVQAQGFEVALQAFIADCVRGSNCPLGTSVSAANASLDRLLSQVRTQPLPAPLAPGGRTVGWSAATTGIAAALYDKAQGWPLLRTGLRRALAGDASVLLLLSDSLSGRQADGTYDNSQEANIAINCVDHPAPRDANALRRRRQGVRGGRTALRRLHRLVLHGVRVLAGGAHADPGTDPRRRGAAHRRRRHHARPGDAVRLGAGARLAAVLGRPAHPRGGRAHRIRHGQQLRGQGDRRLPGRPHGACDGDALLVVRGVGSWLGYVGPRLGPPPRAPSAGL